MVLASVARAEAEEETRRQAGLAEPPFPDEINNWTSFGVWLQRHVAPHVYQALYTAFLEMEQAFAQGLYAADMPLEDERKLLLARVQQTLGAAAAAAAPTAYAEMLQPLALERIDNLLRVARNYRRSPEKEAWAKALEARSVSCRFLLPFFDGTLSSSSSGTSDTNTFLLRLPPFDRPTEEPYGLFLVALAIMAPCSATLMRALHRAPSGSPLGSLDVVRTPLAVLKSVARFHQLEDADPAAAAAPDVDVDGFVTTWQTRLMKLLDEHVYALRTLAPVQLAGLRDPDDTALLPPDLPQWARRLCAYLNEFLATLGDAAKIHLHARTFVAWAECGGDTAACDRVIEFVGTRPGPWSHVLDASALGSGSGGGLRESGDDNSNNLQAFFHDMCEGALDQLGEAIFGRRCPACGNTYTVVGFHYYRRGDRGEGSPEFLAVHGPFARDCLSQELELNDLEPGGGGGGDDATTLYTLRVVVTAAAEVEAYLDDEEDDEDGSGPSAIFAAPALAREPATAAAVDTIVVAIYQRVDHDLRRDAAMPVERFAALCDAIADETMTVKARRAAFRNVLTEPYRAPRVRDGGEDADVDEDEDDDDEESDEAAAAAAAADGGTTLTTTLDKEKDMVDDALSVSV